jgi:hypothetical protein
MYDLTIKTVSNTEQILQICTETLTVFISVIKKVLYLKNLNPISYCKYCMFPFREPIFNFRISKIKYCIYVQYCTIIYCVYSHIMLSNVKEVLQKESGCRLCYIYSRCLYMELFQRSVAPLVFKFGIHQEQAG